MLKARHTVAAQANKHEALTMTETLTVVTLPDAVKRRREKFVPKPRPLSPGRLDARLAGVKQYEDIVSGIATNWSGQCKRELVDAFAGVAIHIDDINARLLLGEKVEDGHGQG
jgi:hypothetical protein